jgi:cell division protein FtsW (lipid II flippase)
MDQENIKQETKKSEGGECITGLLYIAIIFLLIAGWVALLLAPPFGTALAILIIFIVSVVLQSTR